MAHNYPLPTTRTPFPCYQTQEEYDAHLARASVVHMTALSQPWRRRDVRRFGLMRKVAAIVIGRANASAGGALPPSHRTCFEAAARAFQ